MPHQPNGVLTCRDLTASEAAVADLRQQLQRAAQDRDRLAAEARAAQEAAQKAELTADDAQHGLAQVQLRLSELADAKPLSTSRGLLVHD